MATYVNDLRLKEIATGDESGTWGTSTNTNLELIGEAFSFGTEAITTNADTHTTTIADGSTDPGRSLYLKYTGTLDSACTITIGPNTVSKLWFIENGTSGSQNIIISQGSGANVTIPAGHVKAIYSDGAGSGAAMVDAFTDLNLAGTTTIDVLSASGNATIGGTLGVTGIVTLTDDLIIGDGKTIGSASDVDAMTIAANGQVTFSQTLIGTALDISGDIDVDGTANLDVVDIDGAVDISGVLTSTESIRSTNNANTASHNILVSTTNKDNTLMAYGVDRDGTLSGIQLDGKIIAPELDISGDIDVDGTTNLDVVDIDGAVDMASTLNVSGAITGTLGTAAQPNITSLGTLTTLTVDDITIDGSTISDSGALLVDVGLDLTLDAGGGDIILSDDATIIGTLTFNTSDFEIRSRVSDKDLIFKGNDGGSEITALTLDMSDAGTAIFNNKVGIGTSSPPQKLSIFGTGSGNATVQIEGEGGADPYINFLANNTQHWSLGVDDSDSDKFKISEHSALGTNDYFVVDTSGNVGIGQTSPNAPLEIAKNITFSNADTFPQLLIRTSTSIS